MSTLTVTKAPCVAKGVHTVSTLTQIHTATDKKRYVPLVVHISALFCGLLESFMADTTVTHYRSAFEERNLRGERWRCLTLTCKENFKKLGGDSVEDRGDAESINLDGAL